MTVTNCSRKERSAVLPWWANVIAGEHSARMYGSMFTESEMSPFLIFCSRRKKLKGTVVAVHSCKEPIQHVRVGHCLMYDVAMEKA